MELLKFFVKLLFPSGNLIAHFDVISFITLGSWGVGRWGGGRYLSLCFLGLFIQAIHPSSCPTILSLSVLLFACCSSKPTLVGPEGDQSSLVHSFRFPETQVMSAWTINGIFAWFSVLSLLLLYSQEFPVLS